METYAGIPVEDGMSFQRKSQMQTVRELWKLREQVRTLFYSVVGVQWFSGDVFVREAGLVGSILIEVAIVQKIG